MDTTRRRFLGFLPAGIGAAALAPFVAKAAEAPQAAPRMFIYHQDAYWETHGPAITATEVRERQREWEANFPQAAIDRFNDEVRAKLDGSILRALKG